MFDYRRYSDNYFYPSIKYQSRRRSFLCLPLQVRRRTLFRRGKSLGLDAPAKTVEKPSRRPFFGDLGGGTFNVTSGGRGVDALTAELWMGNEVT